MSSNLSREVICLGYTVSRYEDSHRSSTIATQPIKGTNAWKVFNLAPIG